VPIKTLIRLKTGQSIIAPKMAVALDGNFVRVVTSQATLRGFPRFKSPILIEIPLHNIDYVVYLGEKEEKEVEGKGGS